MVEQGSGDSAGEPVDVLRSLHLVFFRRHAKQRFYGGITFDGIRERRRDLRMLLLQALQQSWALAAGFTRHKSLDLT